MDALPDTIAAIATASGEGGIAIVRMSGPESLAIADRVFRGRHKPSSLAANRFAHGFVRSVSGSAAESGDLDEVVVLVYRAPHSYTREDVVEIQGHGGRISARRILRAVLDAGARPAEPGEFTKRAFLNGRIDLLQAEAVADLVHAQSERAAACALEQLEGRLSSVITASYDSLMDVAVDLEASLDFPDGELPPATLSDVSDRLRRAIVTLETLLETWEESRLLREGARVVIAGRPNVGKSTLLNTLLGAERAIVTEIPGTTRDTIEEQAIMDGIPVRLTDTAGIRDSQCRIEKEGVQRAYESVEKADMVLYVVDGSRPPDTEDVAMVGRMGPSKCLVVLNKADQGRIVKADAFPGAVAVACSLLTGEGIDELRNAIVEKLGIRALGQPHAAISERHRQIIRRAIANATEALRLLDTGQENMVTIAANMVRYSIDELACVTGRIYSNDLIDNIFRKFCVGK
jgi:tRNA modification GTPase